MIKIAHYRHSDHKGGMPAICGPRTYTNTARPWQARITVRVPVMRITIGEGDLTAVEVDGVFEVPNLAGRQFESDPEVRMTVNLGVVQYPIACELVADHLRTFLGENPGWTDFEWEIWTKRGTPAKPRVKRIKPATRRNR